MTQNLPELLCPAGDEAALRAAVDCGADAVYLGYSRFGARASAVNFDDEGLERAVRYAHLYHARVHVTVNTLVKQRELADVLEALRAIERAGADAVLVQDLGVLRLARRETPALRLHASTQMALSNALDARWALGEGFTRVVLARECSLETIREVASTGVETEVFAHGALCSAVSGRCLMSSMAGGRSGNRGRCAQPCRQRFTLDGMKGALLSLKDLCLYRDLPALCAAGVRSLKIEGRLKSAEYVAVVATVYRRALDAIAAGRFDPDDPDAMTELRQVFNRGGFTRGHAAGAEDAALCAPARVGHEGVRLGRVEGVRGGFASVRLERALHDGDSLRLGDAEDAETRYAGPDTAKGLLARVRLRPGASVPAGGDVYRLADARQMERARAHAPAPIPVTMAAAFAPGEPMRLTMSDGQSEVCVTGEAAQAARSRASAAEDARRQLDKLGGTPFALAPEGAGRTSLSISIADGLFLPVSALNALRREAVDALCEARIRAFERLGRAERAEARTESGEDKRNDGCGDVSPRSAVPCAGNADASIRTHVPSPISQDTLAVLCPDPSALAALGDAGATLLVWEPLDLRPQAFGEALALLPGGAWVQLPQQATDAVLAALAGALREAAPRLGGVVLGGAGQLALDTSLPMLAGEGVPVTNAEAMKALAGMPVLGFTLWPEWTREELGDMSPFVKPALAKVYGREPLMLLNHCPERVARGLSEGRAQCRLCADGMACARRNAALVDRMGYRFPLRRILAPEGCVLQALGALPTLVDDREGLLSLGAGMLLRFTDETPDQRLRITRAFAAWARGGPSPRETLDALGISPTAGHWRRPVE